jgi:hypothetical protein
MTYSLESAAVTYFDETNYAQVYASEDKKPAALSGDEKKKL